MGVPAPTRSVAALLRAPGPVSFEPIGPVMLTKLPNRLVTMFTLKMHELPPDKVAPLSAMLDVPAIALIVPPPQVPESAFGFATSNPPGNVSVNPMPVSVDVGFGFAIVKVNGVVAPIGLDVAPKALTIVGAARALTCSEADAVPPAPASVDVILPVTLFIAPTAFAVTLTENVQEALAARVAPESAMVLEPATALIVPPPQPPLSAFGLATSSPPGNVSLKPIPESVEAEFGFVIVKPNDVEANCGSEATPNAFAIVGGASALTCSDADAVPPVPPSVDTTLPVTLFIVPTAFAVMLTANVHALFPARLAPVRLTVEDPAVAVMLPPPHEPVSPLGLDTPRPAGRLSLNAIPVSVDAFGFVSVKVSDVEPNCGTDAAPKALAIAGGANTVRVAVLLGAPVPLSFDVIGPVVLFCTPAPIPVTFAETAHDAPPARLPPDKTTELELAAAVNVPPQVLLALGDAATASPAGKLSVKPSPLNGVAFGFTSVNVSVVVPFNGTLVAPNALLIVGTAATVRFALAVLPVPPLVEVTAPVVFVNCPAAAPVTVTGNWH